MGHSCIAPVEQRQLGELLEIEQRCCGLETSWIGSRRSRLIWTSTVKPGPSSCRGSSSSYSEPSASSGDTSFNRSRPRYLADRTAMVVLPPEAAQMAEGQARPRRARQQVKEKEVKCLQESKRWPPRR